MESKLGYLISGPITPKATANRQTSAMTVIATHETEGDKPENNDPISYRISRYTANRQRKNDHRLLPVNESVTAQRAGNGNNRIKVDDVFVHGDQSRTSRAHNIVDISNVEEDGIERSAVKSNGLALHEASMLYPIEAPLDNNAEYTCDNDFERLCRKAKCGAKVKLRITMDFNH